MAPVRADTSKRLGALMLQGWAMLAENCPDCKVPLMRDRASEERLCVNCDTTYHPTPSGDLVVVNALRRPRRQNGSADAGAAPAQAAAASPPAAAARREPEPQPDLEQQEEEEEEEDYDPRADPRLGPFASAAPPAQQEEQGGPTGLGGPKPPAAAAAAAHAAPPPPPPAQQQQQLGEGGPVASGRAAAASSASSGPAPGPAPAPEDDVADLLSTKMLQGWALLNISCPRCSTVLVRQKQTRRMFCVACDAWVVTEQQQQEQAAAAAAALAAGEGPAPAPAPASAPKDVGPAGAEAEAAPRQQQQQQQQPSVGCTAGAANVNGAPAMQAPPPPLSQAGPPRLSGPSTAAADPRPAGPPAAHLVLASVGRTLLAKISEAEGLLQRASADADVGRCRALVALIADCVALLPAVQQQAGRQ